MRVKETYFSVDQVAQRYGVHRGTIWRWLKSNLRFPKPIRLSPGCTRWRLSDIETWEQRKSADH